MDFGDINNLMAYFRCLRFREDVSAVIAEMLIALNHVAFRPFRHFDLPILWQPLDHIHEIDNHVSSFQFAYFYELTSACRPQRASNSKFRIRPLN